MGYHRKRPDLKHPNRRIRSKDLALARDETVRILSKFTDRVFGELERRTQETGLPDGYPSGGSGDGSRSTDDTSTTERTALRLVNGEHSGDVTAEAMKSIRNSFDRAWDHVIAAEDAWDAICASDRGKREREVTLGTCQACLRDDVPNTPNDRIVAGYCPACFKAWQRTADESGVRRDRMTFERSRRDLKVVDSGPQSVSAGA